jgi:hypothetical protein
MSLNPETGEPQADKNPALLESVRHLEFSGVLISSQITLRDLFAAAALANPNVAREYTIEHAGIAAYEYAEAAIKARETKELGVRIASVIPPGQRRELVGLLRSDLAAIQMIASGANMSQTRADELDGVMRHAEEMLRVLDIVVNERYETK